MQPSQVAALVKQDLRLLRADPALVVILTTIPLVVIVFLEPALEASPFLAEAGITNGAEQAIPGFAVMFAHFLMGTMTYGVFREHGWHTWERLRTSMASSLDLALGRLVVPFFVIVLQLCVIFTVGVLLFGLEISGSVAALGVVIGAFSFSLLALGALWVALFRSVVQLNAANQLVALVAAGLGGAIAPLEALPSWAERIAPVTPAYWAMRGFRAVVSDGGGLGEVWSSSAMLLVFALIFLALAGARFRVEETKTSWA